MASSAHQPVPKPLVSSAALDSLTANQGRTECQHWGYPRLHGSFVHALERSALQFKRERGIMIRPCVNGGGSWRTVEYSPILLPSPHLTGAKPLTVLSVQYD